MTMSQRERYLFDLQGFIIIRGLLSDEEVAAINAAFDAHRHTLGEFGPPNQLSGDFTGKPLEGTQGCFRHWSGMLTWPQPHCQPFRHLLCHPRLIPALNSLLGRGWKLDHGADSIQAEAGCEGLMLHGFGSAEFNSGRYYVYQNGRMGCGLINAQIYTTPVRAGDGGLVLVPGSHKANMYPTAEMLTMEEDTDITFQPVLEAGDAVVFVS
eukprot:SAG25_NODE_3286_length_1144_cov_87.281340_1_plen_209_part_01